MNKNELRKIYKEKRKELSKETIDTLERDIYKQLFECDFSTVQNIHIFLPIEKQKEINTYPIIDFLRSQGKNIIISKSNFTDATLTHYLFEKDTVLHVNKYGIPEPEKAKEINVKTIDLVFVPLLISDEKKYRVGYGKGFYDRFLSDCKDEVQTIGLNFFKPVDLIEDLNEFDVPLQKVIYPKF